MSAPTRGSSAGPSVPPQRVPPGVPGRTEGAMRLGLRSGLVLALVSAIGLLAFTWPFVVAPESGLAHSSDGPWLFVLLVPLLLLVLVAETAEGGLDAKAVAMLGVLAAVGAGLRVLGAGMAPLEPLFFLLVVAGRAFGPAFGFVFGCLTLVAGALVTGGVGPWLPFQMLGAGWVALGAGLLPSVPARAERWLLAGYGALAGLLYGALLDLWFWPFLATGELGGDLAYVAGAPPAENLARFALFHLATGLGWDIPRAVLTAALCVLAGPAVLTALRRATRRAAFSAPVTFGER
jgi:energy-coupling factor transport system substrate-specific component